MSPKPEAPRATHMQGPWQVEEAADRWVGVVAAPIGIGAVLLERPRHPRPRTLIARIHGGADHAETIAIGGLIAAAPDLLAACKCALERIQDGAMEQTNEHGQSTQRAERVTADTVARLKAAIAKAEGAA